MAIDCVTSNPKTKSIQKGVPQNRRRLREVNLFHLYQKSFRCLLALSNALPTARSHNISFATGKNGKRGLASDVVKIMTSPR